MPIAQRDSTAASQQAFERAASEAGVRSPRPGPRATGHLDAARIAATLGGAAVTTEAAAQTFGLRFVGLEHHTVEIWFAQPWSEHPGVDALGNLLRSSAFTERVALFGGYELDGCGERMGSSPGAR